MSDTYNRLLGQGLCTEQLPHSAEKAQANEPLLPVMYHGTTRRLWDSKGNGITSLYLTSSRKDAESYADESASNEAYDHKEVEAVVAVFQPETLIQLMADGHIEFDPDWGWVDGLEAEARNAGTTLAGTPTWEASLASCQGICISGFTDAFKALATVTPLGADPTSGT